MTIIFNAKINKYSGCGYWGTPKESQNQYSYYGNETKGPVAFKGRIEDKYGNYIANIRCAWVSMPTDEDEDDGEYKITFESERHLDFQKIDFGEYYDYYLMLEA